jgi:DNA-binding NtrC family response regulator
MVAQGQFRKDLYFRLNVVNLKIPPLRERRDDIAALAEHFLERAQQETGKAHRFSEEAMRLLLAYDWPGNVRELQHAIERTCAMSSGPVLHAVDLPTQLQDFRAHRREEGQSGTKAGEGSADGNGQSAGGIVSIADMEKQAILGTIRQLKGDKLMAARLLGIGKTTLLPDLADILPLVTPQRRLTVRRRRATLCDP